ncbi:MAG: hypothetical protein IJ360_05060 [Clostridia bacterium]|nr:hypothetical protein [Clostridia bacterium]
MKKTIKLVAVVMVIAMLALSLVACAKTLNGKYTSEVDWGIVKGNVTYEFKGNDVTMTTTTGIAGFEKNDTKTGTYEIVESEENADKLVIKFTFGDDTTTYSYSEGELDGEKVIIINGTTFTKVK